jgi:GH15 family glucan-1,4-alpha-glucosidase
VLLEDLSLIGNCQFAALVRNDGAVVWCCMPRFDSPPIFGELLDPDGGAFLIGPAQRAQGRQRYLENTNVLETVFTGSDGSFRVLDFAPRFHRVSRLARPTKIVRIVEPLTGTPRIHVRCSPRAGWSKTRPQQHNGSSYIDYLGLSSALRLTTDVPLAYLDADQPFALTSRRHFVLSWGEPLEEPLEAFAEQTLRETTRYWEGWVKHCDVPPIYQREVIRSALALKLHCYEDTGAIVAAVTTSLPESLGSGRTWDYRYCWLRDAYYSLDAFRLLGHFEEREGFIEFLLNIASSAPDLDLAPLYRIDGQLDLEERSLPNWAGFGGEGPVRVGNAAAVHRQNDVFGEIVLALAPSFLDARFPEEQSKEARALLVRLGRKAIRVAGQPDASIWELRTEWTPQTFSSLMCWAAADRVHRVVSRHEPELAAEFAAGANAIRAQILEQAWSPELGVLASSYGGRQLDASLLQAATLRFFGAGDEKGLATVAAIQRDLSHGGWLHRYATDDGFGHPSVAFVICTFWLVEALAAMGQKQEAMKAFETALEALSPTGLLAEDWDPSVRRLCGNFPQAYSHVGLIHGAFAVAPPWSDVI